MLDGKWVIGNPETEIGGLESVERGPAGVPSYPWRYYSDGVWVVDQLLTVTGKYYKTNDSFWEQENQFFVFQFPTKCAQSILFEIMFLAMFSFSRILHIRQKIVFSLTTFYFYLFFRKAHLQTDLTLDIYEDK